MYYSVDALENGTARLVDDAGGSAFVPAADLPSRCINSEESTASRSDLPFPRALP